MLFALMLASTILLPASTTQVEIAVVIGGDWEGESIDVRLEGVRNETLSGPTTFESRAVSVPGTFAIQVPTGSSSRLTLQGEGLWSAPLLIVAGPERQRLTWRVWPTGTLTGKLDSEEAALPAAIDLTLWPRPGSSLPDEIRLQCGVAVSGAWSCAAPRGVFDWRLGSRGFVSHYGWNQAITAGEAAALPQRPFVRGSSVVGWVEAQECVKLDPKTSVSWAELSANEQEPAAIAGSASTVPLSYIEEQRRAGFFQIVTPPGRFRVAARGAANAASQAVDLTVNPGLEARLIDPLLLRRRADLELDITPQTGPDDMPWQVFLRSSQVREADHSLASWKGHWHRKGLAEGTYDLVIKSYAHDVWWSEKIELRSGESARQVDLPRLRVNGSVFLGVDPAVATLWFGGRKGAESLRFESDASGYFEGSLPRAGAWAVDLVLHQGGQELNLHRVLVGAEEAGLAEVELRLPGVGVRGEVVDGFGSPVAGAKVEATPLDGKAPPTSTRSDEDGQFSLSAIASNQISLHAWTRAGSSRGLIVQLDEGEPAEVRLELESERKISGQVYVGGTPVFGAEIWGFPVGLEGHWILRGIRDRTGLAGDFTIEMPEATRTLDLAVFPPGFAALFRRLPADTERPLLIEVSHLAGELEVRFADPMAMHPLEAALLNAEGIEIPLSSLRGWATSQGGFWSDEKVVVPGLEPGTYVVCGPVSADKPRPCSEGVLQVGGTLILAPGGQS